jgi:hypothetical protein
MFLIKQIIIIIIEILIVGCGGGAGSPGGPVASIATSPATPSNANGEMASSPIATNVVRLELLSDLNSPTDTVSYGGNQKLRATYTLADGVTPVKGVLVTFAIKAGGSLVGFGIDTALTGTDGTAIVPIESTGPLKAGAATATVSLANGTTSALDFAVAPIAISLGSLQFGSNSLAASSTTSVSIQASTNGAGAAGVPISLTADCGTIKPAIPLTDGNGLASATYSSVASDGSSCSGSITISAAFAGQKATNTLAVSAPVASAVNFVSASPTEIYVLGSGATTQSILKFKVLDASGAPAINAAVTVAFEKNIGGVGLGAANSAGPLSLRSDNQGFVVFTVLAGTNPGSVRIQVSLGATAPYAYSNEITVQSGPPEQSRFSLSAEAFNIEGQDRDGATTTLTIRVADRTGNPVPPNTRVNFTAEGGQIQPSCTTQTVNGISSCAVLFSTQYPKPADGRISVLAFTEGVKVFKDSNGNNTFDAGDVLTDQGDAYRDDNENGSYDEGEFVLRRGASASCSSGNWGSPSRANTCDSTTSATTVRAQVTLLMATSEAVMTMVSSSARQLTFRANSTTPCGGTPGAAPCLPLASGTTFSAESSDATACVAGAVAPSRVDSIKSRSDLTVQLGSVHQILLTPADGKTCSGVILRITAKSPSGKETFVSYTIP